MIVLKRIVFMLAALVASALFLLILCTGGASHAALSLLLAVAALGLFRVLPRCQNSDRAALWVAIGVAIILRVGAICCFPVGTDPAHDFGSYFRLAKSLAEDGPYVQSSCAFFPHMLFFALVLSVPFRLFGANVLTYQLCDLTLSLCSLFLLYAVLRETAGKRAAIFGAFAWAFEPALVLYAPLNCHEHYVLTLTFLYAFLLLRFARQETKKPALWALRGGALGLCLLALDLVRPLGTLFLIATLLWLLLRTKKWNSRRGAALALSALVFAGVLFGGKAVAFGAAKDLRLEPLAKTSYGFTILVGSNSASGGMWNGDDSARFLSLMRQDGGRNGYRDANDTVMTEARARWSSRSFEENLRFLKQKNMTLWGGQKLVLDYLRMYMPDPSAIDSHPRMFSLLGLLCNAYVTVLLLLTAITCFFAARRKEPDNGLFLFAAVAFLGFVCMYCLTEASGRYTVSALPFLLLLSAPAATGRIGLKRGRHRE